MWKSAGWYKDRIQSEEENPLPLISTNDLLLITAKLSVALPRTSPVDEVHQKLAFSLRFPPNDRSQIHRLAKKTTEDIQTLSENSLLEFFAFARL